MLIQLRVHFMKNRLIKLVLKPEVNRPSFAIGNMRGLIRPVFFLMVIREAIYLALHCVPSIISQSAMLYFVGNIFLYVGAETHWGDLRDLTERSPYDHPVLYLPVTRSPWDQAFTRTLAWISVGFGAALNVLGLLDSLDYRLLVLSPLK